jgi:Iron-containing redox enzyme
MKGPTNSDVLWGKIHLAEGRLFAATDVFWNHPDLASLLPEFLVQAHFMMRCGFTLMSVARKRALDQPEDPVAVDLAAYLQVHLEEEWGHDQWLLDDILTLGLGEQEVLQAQPCEALIGLVGTQYFWIMQVHPVAVMGYLTLMEGYAPLAEQLEEIRLRTGAPTTAFRCLKAHAEDDPAHLADLNRTLDSMDLSPEQARAVGLCAFAAIEGLATMFEELLEKHLERSVVGSSRELLHARA